MRLHQHEATYGILYRVWFVRVINLMQENKHRMVVSTLLIS